MADILLEIETHYLMPIPTEKIDRHVGKKLREFRESSGLKADDLAHKLGRDSDFVLQIEDGTRHVAAEELWEMCIVLNVSPSAFFVGID